jgi:hypothetical protein
MKIIKSLFVSAAMAVGLMAFASEAQAATQQRRCGNNRPRAVGQRQHNQQQRIGRGVRSGELTGRETLRLAREQYQIQQEKREYRSDGEVTRAERRELQQELNQASRHIYRAKHNGRDRN